MSVSLKRAAIVTGALAATGFVCGVAIGSVVLTGIVIREQGWTREVLRVLPRIAMVGAIYGGPAGAVLTPPLSWLLLRRVSLGRALLETAVGTVIGAGLGLAFSPLHTIQAALGGFVLAALRLRFTRGSARQIAEPSEPAQLAP